MNLDKDLKPSLQDILNDLDIAIEDAKRDEAIEDAMKTVREELYGKGPIEVKSKFDNSRKAKIENVVLDGSNEIIITLSGGIKVKVDKFLSKRFHYNNVSSISKRWLKKALEKLKELGVDLRYELVKNSKDTLDKGYFDLTPESKDLVFSEIKKTYKEQFNKAS